MTAHSGYHIMAGGRFQSGQVVHDYRPTQWNPTYSPAERARIDQHWAREQDVAEGSGRMLYSSDIFRLADCVVEDGQLLLRLGDTCYKDYVGTRDPALEATRANPLGSVVVPITSDGFVPLGRRSPRLDINPGRLFTFGGFFDMALDWTAAQPDVFACIRREIREELVGAEADELYCIGVMYDLSHPHPEIAFSATLDKTRAELQGSGLWSDEVNEMIMVPRQEVTAFLAEHRAQVCDTLVGALELFSRHG
jgi:hypothetical protein